MTVRALPLAALLLLSACATPGGILRPREYDNDPIKGYSWCQSFGCSDLMINTRVSPADGLSGPTAGRLSSSPLP